MTFEQSVVLGFRSSSKLDDVLATSGCQVGIANYPDI